MRSPLSIYLEYPPLTAFSFGLSAGILLVLITAALGGVLDLPSLAAFRSTLAERHIKPWAVVVAISPVVSAALDMPERIATLSRLSLNTTTTLSLVGGTFFAAALGGCWLAMDEAEDPHSRPKRSIVAAFIILAVNALILPYAVRW
jgi:hypothetical protein